ncbi:LOW QUALITY PROTEIN: tissue inhibitor of metalloproteinase [Solenopsis invicta]|uniref:LOW QUALITY PROTEIN: tissue inhibitor of metalloproteinase n=1 Tax=Solenopsis invicta TaxID=13686 RepID=UPI000596171D|nr:LOW QUALITY PROTEIN: tissue inhibitor of metalloproteinase [Solenopsis invicta]
MSSEAPFTRARMYGYWPRPRNIIAVIRWNWASLALTRVLEASTCCVARVSVTSFALTVPEMGRLLIWMHFMLLTVLLAPVQKAAACSCAQAHPQTKFCESDFVIVVRVKKVLPVNDYEIAYKVKINRVFKSNPKADMALMQNLLRTPSSDSMCGVTLNVGDTYVLNGRIVSGKALISYCGLSIRWADTTTRQRKGLRQLYQQGCVCDILYTHWRRKGAVLESSGGKNCLWESTPGPQDCQEKYGVCMALPSGCSWVPSVPYKNCIKEYQRKREQQRSREP